ncbi:MAG: hypothetical protein RQ754_07590 [Desulfuromonadales bacterium]|nr:hypothetical protein [Desulfuromonadales bacterium]
MKSALGMFFFLLALWVPAAHALEVTGHLKSLNQYQQGSVLDQEDVRFSAESLRVDVQTTGPRTGPALELSVEQSLLYQHPRHSISLPQRDNNRIDDLAWTFRSGQTLSGQVQVDRLKLQWQWADKSVTVGRQAVGFGRISLLSPLDVIAPFPPTAIDNEVRPGIDALRTQYFFDIAGELGTILVFGRSEERSSALATMVLNHQETDWLFIGGSLRDRLMLGAGLAGQIGGLGLKSEWVGYQSRNTESPHADLRKTFSLFGIEFEYRFPLDLVVQMQYLFNGTGSKVPSDYLRVAESAPYREGMSYLYGRHYLLAGLARQITPLVDLSSLVIINLKDHSWLFRPVVAVSLANNAQLDIFWNFMAGKRIREDAGQLVPGSEFGSGAESGGVFLKFYF